MGQWVPLPDACRFVGPGGWAGGVGREGGDYRGGRRGKYRKVVASHYNIRSGEWGASGETGRYVL